MKKFLTILTAALLVLVSAFAVGCNVQEQEAIKPSDGVIHVHNVRMAMGAPMTATGNDGTQYIEKSLTATVFPTNALNKGVDFYVEWGEGASRSSEPVSDYLMVVPTSYGSSSAKVRCYKSFGDDKIIITVITHDGGLSDSCTVSFVGFCSDVGFDTSSLLKNDVETTKHKGEYILYSNKTYTIPITADNIFNETTTSFNVKSVGWTGKLKVRLNKVQYVSETLVLDEHNGYSKLFAADIVDNKLTITVNNKTLSEGSVVYRNEGDEDFVIVESVIEDVPTYLFVIVEDKITGITEELRFWIEAGVDSVALDSNTMEFSVNENN